MPTVALQAHFDGHQIILDEPYDLPPHASLIVTVLSVPNEGDSEREWLASAIKSDAFAFLADDAEDIYTLADGEPFHNGG